jgi:excisionase family DNA binding protein
MSVDEAPPATGEHRSPVSTDEAAQLIGVSVITVRRWIKAGKLRAEIVPGQRGPEYRIHLDHRSIGDQRVITDHDRVNGDHRGARPDRRSDEDLQRGAVEDLRHDRLTALLEAVTADNRRLNDERAELYGRLGYLQGELAQAREQLKALQAPKEPIAPPPPAGAVFRPLPAEPDPPRRPWWRFWG